VKKELRMKNYYVGVIGGILLPFIGGYFFLILGGMPVATKGPPLPLERFVARAAIHAAMKGQGDTPSPVNDDEVNLIAGARVYAKNCAVCHGFISSQPSTIAKGLFPKPPQLFDPEQGVTDDPIGESFWKIKNGIRLTGMPGFVDNLTDTEMWQVSQVLVHSDKLPVNVQQELMKKE
jgi:thiosulfate dehydrogenase